MRNYFSQASKKILTTGIILFSAIIWVQAQSNNAMSKDYFTIEGYYKVKWGFGAEFISLWKQNHYPLLKKAMENGDIISITASEPIFHSGEDTRWDFRVIIVYKNVQTAFRADLLDVYKKQLFPDADALKKSEQHRFELLLSHWDIESENDILP